MRAVTSPPKLQAQAIKASAPSVRVVAFIRLAPEAFVGQDEMGAIASWLEVQGRLGFGPAGLERLVSPGEAESSRLIEFAVLSHEHVRILGTWRKHHDAVTSSDLRIDLADRRAETPPKVRASRPSGLGPPKPQRPARAAQGYTVLREAWSRACARAGGDRRA